MGSRSVSFSFTPGENEQIETCVMIPEERRSIIHGIVKNQCNQVVKDAVVKLYEKVKYGHDFILKPVTHTFTDECGQFVFGPLYPNKCYVIKVWLNDVKIRELVIHPEKDECQKQRLSATAEKEEIVEEKAEEAEPDKDESDPLSFDDEFEKIDKIVKMQVNATCTTCEISGDDSDELVEPVVDVLVEGIVDTDDLDE